MYVYVLFQIVAEGRLRRLIHMQTLVQQAKGGFIFTSKGTSRTTPTAPLSWIGGV